VQLTQRGIAFQEAAVTLSQQIESDVASRMGEENMARLRTLLERLANTIDSASQ
jgi:hypothetical protein